MVAPALPELVDGAGPEAEPLRVVSLSPEDGDASAESRSVASMSVSATVRALLSRLRCVSAAPLWRRVVPDV
ncbi:hypothetical protein ACFRU3_42600 [Streptomyces sp. NPDC056910]|uniref:hypothetical protein n=1 Tax=Streptomyces sp. NPDC056910 TaxID=3345964 RepID=UPI00369C14A8